MSLIHSVLSNGVLKTVYEPISGMTAVYYKSGQVDYFYGVAWTDFETVVTAAIPSQAVKTNLVAKYTTASGRHG